jgi:hypothetical protein
MKTPAKVVLLAFVSLGVIAGMAHLFWPGGLPKLIERLTPAKTADAPDVQRPAADTPPAKTTAADELRLAESAYDDGDFGTAAQAFTMSRADATDAETRERADRGLQKAILAWGLVMDIRPLDAVPEGADAELARRQTAAEANPNEGAWLEAARFAAENGLRRKLPFLTRSAIDAAIAGGPVEARLKRALTMAGSRTAALTFALRSQGLLDPVDPVGGPPRPAPAAAATPKPSALQMLSVPAGVFRPETREKLAKAIELEKKGTLEYEQSGPDNPKRKEHRKAAMDALKAARDIYEAAQDEDQNSPSLDRRMHDVMEMLSHLRKETNLGE